MRWPFVSRAEQQAENEAAFKRGYAIGQQDGKQLGRFEQARYDAETIKILAREKAALERDVEVITRLWMDTQEELERRS